MKIVVIGGRGRIGAKLVKALQSLGHEAIAASPSTGVDAVTGRGLAEVLKGSQVVVDVANTSSYDEKTAVEFFEKSSWNLTNTEKDAGVKHHVVLSIVGTERLGTSGYLLAKNIQEKLVKASGIPYTIVQATQFYEFLKSIADSATEGQTVHLPPVLFQPIASDDVVSILADIAVKPPLNKTIEIAGPERFPFADLIRKYLKATQDSRSVIVDDHARYFDMAVSEDSLVPGKNPRLGSTTLENWLKSQLTQRIST